MLGFRAPLVSICLACPDPRPQHDQREAGGPAGGAVLPLGWGGQTQVLHYSTAILYGNNIVLLYGTALLDSVTLQQ